MKNKKTIFIETVKNFMLEHKYNESEDEDLKSAWEYLQIMEQANVSTEKPPFTEKGKAILIYLKENKDIYNNMFKAKDIGEGLGISSRIASGSIRKLVTDGYVEKIGESPVVYSLTNKGDELTFEEEEG